MRAFSVKWLVNDSTIIHYNDEFEAQGWVLKADILKDAIAMLQERYDHVLKIEQLEWYKKNKGENYATK